MEKIIGMYGGNFVTELGSLADMQFFFDCIAAYAVGNSTDPKWRLITDRLYRRYVAFDDLLEASALMDEIRHSFSSIGVVGIAFPSTAGSRLDPSKANLADVFAHYFAIFSKCRESAERLFSRWKEYVPVRVVITDTQEFVNDSVRKLEEYDKLTGEPFWKR